MKTFFFLLSYVALSEAGLSYDTEVKCQEVKDPATDSEFNVCSTYEIRIPAYNYSFVPPKSDGVYYTKYGIHDPIYEGETVDLNSDSNKTLLQVEVGWNTQDSDKNGCYTKVMIGETEHTCNSCSLCMESASVSADCSNIPNGRAVECMKLQKYESNENDVWFPLTAEALPAQDSDDSSGEERRCRLFCFLDK